MIDTSKIVIAFDYTGPEIEEIARNLNMLYETPVGTVPLDREFGLDTDFVGYPLDVAQNMISIEIVEKTETYEPRVKVQEVTFTSTVNGVLIPNVLITRSETTDNEVDEEGDE
jgi:phage baseplate assembly protein W